MRQIFNFLFVAASLLSVLDSRAQRMMNIQSVFYNNKFSRSMDNCNVYCDMLNIIRNGKRNSSFYFIQHLNIETSKLNGVIEGASLIKYGSYHLASNSNITIPLLCLPLDTLDLVIPILTYGKSYNSLWLWHSKEDWNVGKFINISTWMDSFKANSYLLTEYPANYSLMPIALVREPIDNNSLRTRAIDCLMIDSIYNDDYPHYSQELAESTMEMIVFNSVLIYSKAGKLLHIYSKSLLPELLLSDTSCALTAFDGRVPDRPVFRDAISYNRNRSVDGTKNTYQDTIDVDSIDWKKDVNNLFSSKLSITQQYVYSWYLERALIKQLIADNSMSIRKPYKDTRFHSPQWVLRNRKKIKFQGSHNLPPEEE